MKKKVGIVIVLGILLIVVIGCSNRPHVVAEEENLIIINNTNQKIYSFGLEQRNSSGGGQYADGSPVKKGESFGFQMDKYDDCEFVLTAKEKEGNEILRTQKFKENFS
ncbi:MAG: hypothetical protein RR128_00670 [Clostridium sp.]